jgi:hypothetical protein
MRRMNSVTLSGWICPDDTHEESKRTHSRTQDKKTVTGRYLGQAPVHFQRPQFGCALQRGQTFVPFPCSGSRSAWDPHGPELAVRILVYWNRRPRPCSQMKCFPRSAQTCTSRPLYIHLSGFGLPSRVRIRIGNRIRIMVRAGVRG